MLTYTLHSAPSPVLQLVVAVPLVLLSQFIALLLLTASRERAEIDAEFDRLDFVGNRTFEFAWLQPSKVQELKLSQNCTFRMLCLLIRESAPSARRVATSVLHTRV